MLAGSFGTWIFVWRFKVRWFVLLFCFLRTSKRALWIWKDPTQGVVKYGFLSEANALEHLRVGLPDLSPDERTIPFSIVRALRQARDFACGLLRDLDSGGIGMHLYLRHGGDIYLSALGITDANRSGRQLRDA